MTASAASTSARVWRARVWSRCWRVSPKATSLWGARCVFVSPFFGLALRRLFSRPSLTILSLLSIALAIGMVASIPVFSQGVSYLLLQDELAANRRHLPSSAPDHALLLYCAQKQRPFAG